MYRKNNKQKSKEYEKQREMEQGGQPDGTGLYQHYQAGQLLFRKNEQEAGVEMGAGHNQVLLR